jgi:serine protease Do
MMSHLPRLRTKILVVLALVGALGACSSKEGRDSTALSQLADLPAATAAPLEAGGTDANIFVKLSKGVVPSVVNISTTKRVRQGGGPRGRPDDLFRKFFDDFLRQHGGGRGGSEDDYYGEEPHEDEGEAAPGPKDKKGTPRAYALGTGFIIEEDGLILTNNHVIDGADEVKVNFTEDEDEKPTDGEVVGRDMELDLALIRVKTKKKLTPLRFGDSDALEVGEYVMAVGNPFGQGHSVTHGIISAKERKAPDFVLANYLQTDTPINPGNSGGPLVNLKGEVIGINNAIDQRAQGIGFAIPVNLVKKVLPQLKTKGTVTRGYIGVLVNEMTPELASKMGLPEDARNPLVARVYPGEPAEKAGVREYDIIQEFNGKPIRSAGDLVNAVTQVPVGEKGEMKVLRGKKGHSFQIQVVARPSREEMVRNGRDGKGKPGPKKAERVETGMELETLTAAIASEVGVPSATKGVLVGGLDYDGPADRSGIQRGDVIVEVDRKPTRTVDEFYAVVNSKKSYLVRVLRGDGGGHEAYAVVVLDLKETE